MAGVRGIRRHARASRPAHGWASAAAPTSRCCRTCRRSADTIPGFEASGWYGVAAPKDAPPKNIAALNKEINAGLTDAKTKAQLADLGRLMLPGPPADYAKFVAGETEKRAKVIKTAGIKAQ